VFIRVPVAYQRRTPLTSPDAAPAWTLAVL
jgi:hypothetical protein